MNRRDFLKKSSIVTAGTCCLGVGSLLSSCTKAVYAPATVAKNEVFLDRSQLDNNSFVIVKNDQLEGPIYVRKNGNDYIAFSMICTHRGCIVDPAGDILVCPCHGAEFSNTGKVLSPPAPKNLPSYKVKIDGDQLIITLV